MPPKKAQQQPSKKTDQKKKEKIIEDKTFGLKNKKGAKQQTYIKNVQQQVKYGNQKQSKVKEMEMAQKTNKKDAKKKEAEELNLLFRPVMEAQKVSKGVDPKSVLCAFYKQGMCTKGDKCKFSHDLSIQRKAEKRSVYSDGKESELSNDTMDNWDEDKLKEVVNKKHGESNEKKQKTDIVCKHFIQALEDMKYGWFWSCPTGDKCIYRHALPPGFVLKKDKKKLDEPEEEQISLEELVEAERAKLGGNLTRVTLETFQQWKRRKIEDKKKKLEEDQAKKRNELKQGKSLGVTGRELFQFKPELMEDDDDEAEDVSYQRENDDDPSVTIRDVSVEAFAAAAMEVDASLETATNHRGGAAANASNDQSSSSNKPEDDESGKLDQAAAILPEDPTIAAIAAAEGALANGACAEALLDDVEVDEDLFDAELDIDQELEQIDLED